MIIWHQSLELGMLVTLLSHSDTQMCVPAGYQDYCQMSTERVNCFNELLDINERDKTFFQRLITNGETRIHYYEPESKRLS